MPKPAQENVKIVKMGQETPVATPTPVSSPKIAGRKKSMKTFPRGILKKHTIKAVRDPAKAPPIKKSKGTLRILTEKGIHARRQRIKKTVRTMPEHKVRETLKKAGMSLNPNTPPELAKEILESGMEAGMIVVK
jgi:hypothetical protein